MLIRTALDDPQFVPRNFSRQEASSNILLSKLERLIIIKVERRMEYVSFDVRRLLRKCEARRAVQRPPLMLVAPLLPRRVGEYDGLHPEGDILVRVSPFSLCLAPVSSKHSSVGVSRGPLGLLLVRSSQVGVGSIYVA